MACFRETIAPQTGCFPHPAPRTTLNTVTVFALGVMAGAALHALFTHNAPSAPAPRCDEPTP